MSINENIAAQIHNELNPSANDAVGGRLYEIREAYTEQYSKRLIGKFASDPAAREEKLNAFRKEFDETIKAKIVKGSENLEADPTNFKDEKEQKKREGFMGIVDAVFGAIAGFLGGIGGFVWNIVKQFPGVQSMVSGIGGWLSDKTDDRSDNEKNREKRAAGMAAALGERFTVAGMNVSLPAEAQAELFHSWKDKKFDQAVQKNTAVYEISNLVPPNTVPTEIKGQEPAPADATDTNKRSNVSADANAANRGQDGAAASPR